MPVLAELSDCCGPRIPHRCSRTLCRRKDRFSDHGRRSRRKRLFIISSGAAAAAEPSSSATNKDNLVKNQLLYTHMLAAAKQAAACYPCDLARCAPKTLPTPRKASLPAARWCERVMKWRCFSAAPPTSLVDVSPQATTNCAAYSTCRGSASMSDESIAGRGTSLFSRSMSCGNEGAILPIVVFDLVSLLTFYSRSRTWVPAF
jgi:hypothetical protein